MIVNPGIRRFLGSAIQRLFNSASVSLPLTHTAVPQRGSITPSFTRATTETGQKWDEAGYLDFTALAGEIVFKGARRERNLVSTTSEVFTNAAWTKVSSTVTAGFDDPDGGTGAYRLLSTGANAYLEQSIAAGTLPIANTAMMAWYIKSNTAASQTVKFGRNATITTKTVTTSWQRLSHVTTSAGGTNFYLQDNGGNNLVVLIYRAAIYDITGETDQTTIRPYVSVGVESAPAYHGSMVDGVKCYDTDRSGNPISTSGSYPLVGYVPWPARTNHFLNSSVPATQTSGALSTGTYTLWMTGTGSVAVAGNTATITGAGTATDGSPVTFVVTVGGTVDYTVTGSPTKAQSENGAYQSPYILTAGAAVARNADVDQYPTTAGPIAAVGAISLDFTPYHAPSGTIALWGTYVDASNYTAILHDATNLIFRKRIAGSNYDATIANAFVSGTTYKVAATWGAAGTAIYLDGVAGTPHANTTAAQIAATMQVGADGNSLQQPGAGTTNLRIWQRQLSSPEGVAVTA